MRVLVTGASGFVGKYLVATLAAKGHALWGIGRSPTEDSIPGLKEYHDGDLADDSDEGLREFCRAARPDTVVHLAGLASVGASWQYPVDTIDVSVVGTSRLFDALVSVVALPQIWINIGSSEEYAPSRDPLNEDSRIGPSSPYGFAKVAQSRLAAYLCRRGSVHFIHFRPFNHIGAAQSRGFVVADVAARIADIKKGLSKSVLRVGNLDPLRDFLDVRDVVEVYRLAVEGFVPDGVYNIASGTGRTIRSVVDDLLRIADVDAEIIQDPALFRTADIPVRIGSAAKLQNVTGWKPMIDWERTLSDVLSR